MSCDISVMCPIEEKFLRGFMSCDISVMCFFEEKGVYLSIHLEGQIPL